MAESQQPGELWLQGMETKEQEGDNLQRQPTSPYTLSLLYLSTRYFPRYAALIVQPLPPYGRKGEGVDTAEWEAPVSVPVDATGWQRVRPAPVRYRNHGADVEIITVSNLTANPGQYGWGHQFLEFMAELRSIPAPELRSRMVWKGWRDGIEYRMNVIMYLIEELRGLAEITQTVYVLEFPTLSQKKVGVLNELVACFHCQLYVTKAGLITTSWFEIIPGVTHYASDQNKKDGISRAVGWIRSNVG